MNKDNQVIGQPSSLKNTYIMYEVPENIKRILLNREELSSEKLKEIKEEFIGRGEGV